MRRLAAVATLLILLAPTARAQSPSEFHRHFGRWAEQSERILAAQARNAEPRALLRAALLEHRDSPGTLPEPLRSSVQPLQMQFTAALVLDSANKHRAKLAPAEFAQLLALSETIADHCHKAYPHPGNACTNEKYWTLKGGLCIARAKQPGADAAKELQRLPVLQSDGLAAAAREPFAAARVESACSSWWHLLRVQLLPETLVAAQPAAQAAYFDAMLVQLPALLAGCDEALHRLGLRQSEDALDRLTEAIAEGSRALGRDAAADSAAVRAAAQPRSRAEPLG